MSSELDQASTQLTEQQQQHELQINVGQVSTNLKQFKSFEILTSAHSIIFTCNTKLLLFMILSIIPLFSSMVFFDVKLQKLILSAPKLLDHRTHKSGLINRHGFFSDDDDDDDQLELWSESLQLCMFWLVLYPVMEIFSMIITMRVAAKVTAGDQKQATVREILCCTNSINIKGISVTYLCVHLLSNLTLLGIFEILVYSGFLTNFNLSFNIFNQIKIIVLIFPVLIIAMYCVAFVILSYKYLDWSAYWNMSMVISILGEETGTGAFGMADYYGKHCRKTGFQLMLVCFAFGNLLRLPFLIAGLCKESVAGIMFACVSIGLFCFVNLVKWVVFVVYFSDCKQQTLGKKADEKVIKPRNASDAC